MKAQPNLTEKELFCERASDDFCRICGTRALFPRICGDCLDEIAEAEYNPLDSEDMSLCDLREETH